MLSACVLLSCLQCNILTPIEWLSELLCQHGESILFLEFCLRILTEIIAKLLTEVPKKKIQDYNIVSAQNSKKSDDDINSFGLLYYLIIANSNECKKREREYKSIKCHPWDDKIQIFENVSAKNEVFNICSSSECEAKKEYTRKQKCTWKTHVSRDSRMRARHFSREFFVVTVRECVCVYK